MKYDFLFDHHVVNGLYPKADAFATSGQTDFINLKNYRRLTFFIHTGDATAGTADGVVTVQAADNAAGDNPVDIPFKYRKCLSSTTVDTWGALTDAAAAGFAMDAADNALYAIEVLASDVEAAQPGKPFVALTVTEDTDDPIVAGILAILSGPRYPQEVPVTAIA